MRYKHTDGSRLAMALFAFSSTFGASYVSVVTPPSLVPREGRLSVEASLSSNFVARAAMPGPRPPQGGRPYPEGPNFLR